MRARQAGRRWWTGSLGLAGLWAGQLLAVAHPGHAWLDRGVAHAVLDPWHLAGCLGLAAICGAAAWLSRSRALRWWFGTGAILSGLVALRWVAAAA